MIRHCAPHRSKYGVVCVTDGWTFPVTAKQPPVTDEQRRAAVPSFAHSGIVGSERGKTAVCRPCGADRADMLRRNTREPEIRLARGRTADGAAAWRACRRSGDMPERRRVDGTQEVRWTSRRRLIGTAVVSAVIGALGYGAASEAKRKKRKGRCRQGATRCGRRCCGAVSQCVAAQCYCTGAETDPATGCQDVATVLIELIAEVSGQPPAIIGANPALPLEEQVELNLQQLAAIDELLQKTFEIAVEVPYYSEGIAAGAAIIREELAKKG
jgi:hypothetical protein